MKDLSADRKRKLDDNLLYAQFNRDVNEVRLTCRLYEVIECIE